MTQTATLEALGDGQYALSGDLVFDSAPRLLAEGDIAFGALRRAAIDLARVGRVDSAGLALLLEWSLVAHAAGRVISYRNVPGSLVTLAGISEVSELLGATPSSGG